MEIKDEKINEILEKSKKYRENLASNIDSFKNTEKEFDCIGKIFEEEFKRNAKEFNINDENNIFLKCKISKQEALNGCTKKIKYKQICEDGKERQNMIDLKIPNAIQNNQSIVLYNNGNYIKEKNQMSNVIIKIEIN